MNTQQKRVKWSRGETTDALEERTDTGITNTSAELMENVICDIYGNVSRRPALKLLKISDSLRDASGLILSPEICFIPFFINDNDYILIGGARAFRIKNREIVAEGNINSSAGVYYKIDKNTSYAQQNNYMIIASNVGIVKATLELQNNSDDFSIKIEKFIYSGGWYAPNGTTDYAVSDADITGLEFNKDKKGASPYTATNPDGSTTVYSLLDTGLPGALLNVFEEKFPLGSIIYMPNLGCSFRLEGYTLGGVLGSGLIFPNIVFDGVVNYGGSVPSSGTYAVITSYNESGLLSTVAVYKNGVKGEERSGGTVRVIDNKIFWSVGSTWSDVSDAGELYVYGSLLTPIVDKSLTDSNVNVTTGYISLSAQGVAQCPRPSIVLFKDQRLWTSRYIYSSSGAVGSTDYQEYTYPGLVVSSQIAKYTDFKNDYNYENEAITLDILTRFKEEVIYLADYNGLKIFTDYAEYDYNGGVVKQSENGSLKGCQPLVFGSLLLYADKTGHQIKAMQYELQSNIFASNIINNLCPSDLVNYPIKFAGEEEKEHYVGRFLYVLNSGESSPLVSVCDFVPDTQNIIWTRYKFGWAGTNQEVQVPAILDIVPLKKPIFIVAISAGYLNREWSFAEWDYDAVLDFQTKLKPTDTVYKVVEYGSDIPYRSFFTFANTKVAVYDGDKYMWDDITDDSGQLSKSLSSLTNPIVGIPIDAKIRSHPIDIGGKTKSIVKRISKSLLSMRNTNAGAITVNKKTGYWNPDNSYVNFYNCTGMKREVKLEIENIHSAKFTIESVLMNIEYGTLVS